MKKILSALAISVMGLAYSQNFNAVEYPKGIYETFEDFRSKNPSSDPKLSTPQTTDEIAYRFTNFDDKNKKIKKAFAISDGKNLYISVIGLMKNFSSEDKGQAWDGGIYYLKAENHGGYLFLKDYFTSNSAAMWGGLIAAASARRQKGVIYEEEKENFNLFKNLDEFKTFMQVTYPNVKADFDKKAVATDQKEQEVDIITRNLDSIKS